MTDPIVRLYRDLREHQKPSLVWALEWAPDGGLQRAWDACACPMVMAWLLQRFGVLDAARFVDDERDTEDGSVPGALKMRFAASGEIAEVRCVLRRVPGERLAMDGDAAARIRELVPTVPGLNELLRLRRAAAG
jgi:hypothetical protein